MSTGAYALIIGLSATVGMIGSSTASVEGFVNCGVAVGCFLYSIISSGINIFWEQDNR